MAKGTPLLLFVATLIAASLPRVASAQLNTQHVKGSVGLKAGSPPPPDGYIVAPLFYLYGTDTVRDRDGRELPPHPSIDASLFGAGYSRVTTKKILGGNYGFTILFPIGANKRLESTALDVNPGAGLTDSVFVPASLGWSGKRADAIASFTIFAPTGRYEAGASDNTGLGMWGFEPAVGTTVYLDEKHRYHVATLASFDMQTTKKNTDTKVGNQLNLEGGIGASLLKGGLTTGLCYYTAIKASDDELGRLAGILVQGRNRVFALGPEVSLALATGGKVRGFVTVRYFKETYARTTTQGNAWFIQATFLTKPFPVPAS